VDRVNPSSNRSLTAWEDAIDYWGREGEEISEALAEEKGERERRKVGRYYDILPYSSQRLFVGFLDHCQTLTPSPPPMKRRSLVSPSGIEVLHVCIGERVP
jgi:hypothetical protein